MLLDLHQLHWALGVQSSCRCRADQRSAISEHTNFSWALIYGSHSLLRLEALEGPRAQLMVALNAMLSATPPPAPMRSASSISSSVMVAARHTPPMSITDSAHSTDDDEDEDEEYESADAYADECRDVFRASNSPAAAPPADDSSSPPPPPPPPPPPTADPEGRWRAEKKMPRWSSDRNANSRAPVEWRISVPGALRHLQRSKPVSQPASQPASQPEMNHSMNSK